MASRQSLNGSALLFLAFAVAMFGVGSLIFRLLSVETQPQQFPVSRVDVSDSLLAIHDEIGRVTARLDKVEKAIRDAEARPSKNDFDSNPRPHSPAVEASALQKPAQPSARAGPNDLDHTKTAVVVFCAKRADYLRHTLDHLFRFHPGNGQFPVFVSQDGDDESVAAATRGYGDCCLFPPFLCRLNGCGCSLSVCWPCLFPRSQPTDGPPQKVKEHITHRLSYEDSRDLELSARKENLPLGYYKIAAHFGWAFRRIFSLKGKDGNPSIERLIVLEEDLQIAPDFFSYFGTMSGVLEADPTLFCVSAFNDNGIPAYAHDERRVERSDFFPGLGWMMTRSLWDNELRNKWPKGFWDDWLREPPQRKGRACIRPEVSRTFTFGAKGGVSGGQFNSILSSIRLNDKAVEFSQLDLDYLKPEVFDAVLIERVKAAKRISRRDLRDLSQFSQDVLITYGSHRDFAALAQLLGIMTDEKAGIPRTSYRGVVTVLFRKDARLFILREGPSPKGEDPIRVR